MAFSFVPPAITISILFQLINFFYFPVGKSLNISVRFTVNARWVVKIAETGTKSTEKTETPPRLFPKVSVPDYIMKAINEDAAKRNPQPMYYILGIESGGGCNADPFSDVNKAISCYTNIDISKGITRVILKTEKQDEKINFYPIGLDELKKMASLKIQSEARSEMALSIDQIVQSEIDKRGDKKPFYKFKLVENQIKDLVPVEDPPLLTRMILPPGVYIAYDPAGTGKYTRSNMKFDIDAAVKKYSEKINPPKSSQQEAKQQDKPKEAAIKTFGAGISEKDLKEAEKSVRQASQERINEDKAARDNPLNANRPK